MVTSKQLRAGFEHLTAALAPGGSPPQWVVRAVSASVAALLVGAIALVPVVGSAQILTADVRSDADWILSAQLPDGAIANYVDKQAVWPYLSSFGAIGLARAFELTGNKAYSEAAWRWLSWYQAHQDAQGFVTDYVMQNGALVSTGQMDSTDSYAGMFLLALRSTYRVTADRTRLATFKPGVLGALKAIEATQDTDGLTWAKPSWHVKYLMDQAETYAGLIAAADLGSPLGDSALTSRAQADANKMKNGVETLWNAQTNAYDWAKHDTGAKVTTNWSYLYSDALQQVWAISFGLVPQARANALLTRFAASQPTWAMPLSTAVFSGGTKQTVGYWPVAGLAFSTANKTVSGAVLSIRSASITSNRAWPYTTGNAGQLIAYEAFTSTTSMIASLPSALLGTVTKAVTELASPAPTTTRAPATTTPPTTAAVVKAAAPAPTTTAPAATTTPTSTPPTTGVVRLDLGLINAGVSLGSGRLGISAGVGPLPTIQLSVGGSS